MPNIISAPQTIREQIEEALRVLRKDGYSVQANEDPTGALSVVISFGASEQTFKFRETEWRTPGAVQKKVVDDLNI
ncbi:MAG TPA: hypothetical protein VF283_04615 [Bryobacteraceae bacterium]